ncbi:MAG: hypothetical protein ACR2NN_03055 [Bryobacteraceae bacterium]
MTNLNIPTFSSDAEEAEWWDAHMEIVGENLMEAIRNGTARRGTARMLSEAFRSPVLMVRLTEGDAAKIRTRAAEHGQDESAYIAALVHDALQ